MSHLVYSDKQYAPSVLVPIIASNAFDYELISHLELRLPMNETEASKLQTRQSNWPPVQLRDVLG